MLSVSLFFCILQGQLGVLQDKIDHLERLLAENNEIIANIRDSVINLRETVKDGKMFPEGNMSQGDLELLPPAPVLLPIHSEDCMFAARTYSKAADGVQVQKKEVLRLGGPIDCHGSMIIFLLLGHTAQNLPCQYLI